METSSTISAVTGSLPRTSIDFHYLGIVDFDHAVALQKRLVYECGGEAGGRFACLLCEHPPIVSVGRAGSRGHVHFSPEQLRRQRLELRWIGRGGTCVLHSPGQLAIYPIFPLQRHGLTVGVYLERLQAALLDTVNGLGVPGYTRPGRFGIWGQSGMLAAFGVAVHNWITSHGAFLNVNCPLVDQRLVDTNPCEMATPGDLPTMSSLLEETDGEPTMGMEEVSRRVASRLAHRFNAREARWNLSHPLFPEIVKQASERHRQEQHRQAS
ncbi:MAG: hypothetical protein WD045_14445 [Pirellulaceae bacterium]